MRFVRLRLLLLILSPATIIPVPVFAQERAYFVTYDHYMEERGNFEVALATTTGFPTDDNDKYTAPWVELE